MKAQSMRALAVGVVLASSGMLTGCAFGSGPLETPPAHGYGPMIVDDGSTFTDAFEVIFIPGDKPVTIKKIELLDSPGLELIEVLIAGEKREANFQFDKMFPPVDYETGPLIPAEGAVLLPAAQQSPGLKGYALIMGMKVKTIGIHVRGGYRVAYTVDGRDYAYDVKAEITICTPDAAETNQECLAGESED